MDSAIWLVQHVAVAPREDEDAHLKMRFSGQQTGFGLKLVHSQVHPRVSLIDEPVME